MRNEAGKADRAVPCRLGVLALAALTLTPGTAWAGSVFMKNGYIIQGPIHEADDESVILAWDYGELTIHRRFIDEVSFDPGEKQRMEKRIREREELQRELEETVPQEREETEELDELPADLDVFLRLYGDQDTESLLAADGDPAGGTANDSATDVEVTARAIPVEPETADSGDPSTPEPDVEDVGTAPTSLAEERVYSEDLRAGLRPPEGWEVQKHEGADLVVLGPEGDGAARPSVNLVALPRGDLSLDECRELVREEQESSLEEFEVLNEGTRVLSSGQEVFEVVARGVRDGRDMILRQVLVPSGETLWLFSGFSRGTSTDPGFALVEEVLGTLEFAEVGSSAGD